MLAAPHVVLDRLLYTSDCLVSLLQSSVSFDPQPHSPGAAPPTQLERGASFDEPSNTQILTSVTKVLNCAHVTGNCVTGTHRHIDIHGHKHTQMHTDTHTYRNTRTHVQTHTDMMLTCFDTHTDVMTHCDTHTNVVMTCDTHTDMVMTCCDIHTDMVMTCCDTHTDMVTTCCDAIAEVVFTFSFVCLTLFSILLVLCRVITLLTKTIDTLSSIYAKTTIGRVSLAVF